MLIKLQTSNKTFILDVGMEKEQKQGKRTEKRIGMDRIRHGSRGGSLRSEDPPLQAQLVDLHVFRCMIA